MTPMTTAASAPPEDKIGGDTPEAQEILPTLLYAFAPLHKRAFGVATGVAGATFMMLLTIGALVLPSAQSFPIGLLGQYFAGYDRSWIGVIVGGAWGFVVAFVAGWFGAFCRNTALAITAFMIRTRAELTETRDFLDHI